MQTTNRANEGMKGQGHFFTLAQMHLHMKMKSFFLRNYWAIFNQVLYVSFQVQGNEIH